VEIHVIKLRRPVLINPKHFGSHLCVVAFAASRLFFPLVAQRDFARGNFVFIITGGRRVASIYIKMAIRHAREM
jgi:hypothetical protein